MPRKLFPPFNEKYVRFTLSNPGKSFLYVYGAGIVYPDIRYEFAKLRDSYLFEYIVSGSGFIECNGVSVNVSAGDCIVIPQGKYVHYGADKKDPYVKLWFSAVGDFASALFDACMPKNKDFEIRRVNTYALFERLLGELEKEGDDDIGVLTHTMLDIMLAVTGKCEVSDSTCRTRAVQIKQYIDNFIRDDIKITKIAEHLGISERSAVKAFREEYGIAPSKYIRKCRLESACELLATTDKTVSDIGHMLRYCDQSYFSTDFKKEYGVYPSEFREKARAERFDGES